LLLPEVKLVDQLTTLITPRIGFRERQKLTLGDGIKSHDIKLLPNIHSRTTFQQFQFSDPRELGDILAEAQQGQLNVYYDPLWSKI